MVDRVTFFLICAHRARKVDFCSNQLYRDWCLALHSEQVILELGGEYPQEVLNQFDGIWRWQWLVTVWSPSDNKYSFHTWNCIINLQNYVMMVGLQGPLWYQWHSQELSGPSCQYLRAPALLITTAMFHHLCKVCFFHVCWSGHNLVLFINKNLCNRFWNSHWPVVEFLDGVDRFFESSQSDVRTWDSFGNNYRCDAAQSDWLFVFVELFHNSKSKSEPCKATSNLSTSPQTLYFSLSLPHVVRFFATPYLRVKKELDKTYPPGNRIASKSSALSFIRDAILPLRRIRQIIGQSTLRYAQILPRLVCCWMDQPKVFQ